jgi:capsule polysaccharide export protein KpsE/RkpR
VFIEPKDVIQWVNSEKAKLQEFERDQMTVSLKVDSDAKRGIIADVETELRKANARLVLYSTLQRRTD